MADPAKAYLLTFPYIWYQTLGDEIRDTWARMPSNLLGVPVFALLIALHAPLWKYFGDLIRSLSRPNHRRVVVAAIVLVSLGYLIIFATVFDYSRWISNWAVCMFLILHAVKTLPGAQAHDAAAERSADLNPRLDRHLDPAGGDRETVLDDARPKTSRPGSSPYPHIERAFAAMTDMRLLEADHERAKFG